MMHGFINVFGGGVLGKSAGLDEETMTKILSEEDASRIVFDDDALRYGESRIACAEITQFRRSLFTSFGSCSFDEPREDLRALGWMP